MQVRRPTVMWQSQEQQSLEYCTLAPTPDGYTGEGLVLQALDRQPLRIDYQITCNHHWQTRLVSISQSTGSEIHHLRLTVDEQQRWWRDGVELEQFAGLFDVDLSITPLTNTLPIRRLKLSVGESAAVTALWVSFPERTLQPLAQTYTRLAENRYRYHSLPHDFTAELTVDETGLVIDYEHLFTRVATDG